MQDLDGLSLKVVPNPTSSLVNVQFSKPIFEAMDAALYSVSGILVKSQTVQIGSTTVQYNLADLPSGVYLLRLKSQSGVLTERILKE